MTTMGNEPVLYENARRALAEARRVDEAKSIRDKAVAMQVYAKQAKDRQLIEHATEIRLRAERKAGELLAEMDKNKGAIAGKTGRKGRPVLEPTPKLSDLSITKDQSSRWQKLAGIPEREFEDKVTRATDTAVAVIDAPPSGKRSGKGRGKGKPPRDTAPDDNQTKQPPRSEVAGLIRTWVKASAGARREFVRERWDEISVVRKQLDANGADHEDRWIESDTLPGRSTS
jgi:hypothetical protein